MPVKKKASLAIVFLIVFMDLVGFGMILPLSTFLAKDFNASATEIGLLMTLFSLMQFIFSPFWGKLSDKIGRRPVLLMSVLCSGLSYVGYAFSTELWMLFVWRGLAGLFSANISTAMAYIADITEEKDRSKSMGLIGAAFGLGFMMGPFIGGVLGSKGALISSAPPFGQNFAALIAGIICILNFCFAYKILEESKKDSKVRKRKSRFAMLKQHFVKPDIGRLLLLTLVSVFSMANMESTIFLFAIEKFEWSFEILNYGFAYIGLVIVFTQGFLIRKLLPKFGEKILLRAGIISASLGLFYIPYVDSIITMALSQTMFALGTGLINPSLTGSISILTSAEEQGEVMGVNQSMSALGRIIGPALGGFIYGNVSQEAPYFLAAILMFTCLFLVPKGLKNSALDS